MTQKFLISVLSYIHENVERNCQLVKTMAFLNLVAAMNSHILQKYQPYREDCYYEKLIFFNTTIYRHIFSSVNHISSQFSWCFPRSCSVRPLFLKTISPLNMIWAFLFSSLSNGLSDSKQMQITQSQRLNSSQKTIQILLFVIQFLSIQFLISCKYGAKIS